MTRPTDASRASDLARASDAAAPRAANAGSASRPAPAPAPVSAFDFDDPADAPDASDLGRLARIRSAFLEADYTVDGVERLLGAEAADALHRDLLVPAAMRAADAATGDDAHARELAALIRLFLLAEPVDVEDVPAADDLIAARFATCDDVPRDDATRDDATRDDATRDTSTRDTEERASTSPDDRAADVNDDAIRPNRLIALVDVRPYAADDGLDTWVASDLGGVQLAAREASGRPAPLRRDHVVGIGPATTNLAQLTPRDDIDRALDLGVGMGVQSIHLLSHARFVVATDISARALAFARVNLLLAAPALGIDPARLDERVSLRLGDLLEPVAGERFDLVVSNPPFVITPRRTGEGASDQYTYRDGGRPGDAIVEGLVRGLGDVLAPSGVAIMLGNWEVHGGDATWHSRLESWPAPDVDLWVVQRERATPIEYADMWLRDAAENAELDSWREAFADYLADFSSRAVDEVGMGILVLRRREGDGAVDARGVVDALGGAGARGAVDARRGVDARGSVDARGTVDAHRRFEELGHQLGQPLAATVRGTLDRVAWLRSLSDAELWDETLVVAGDVTEERHARPGDEHPSAILLRQGGGFRRTFPCSTELAAFVSVCDGELAAGQIVGALAELFEVPAAELGDALALVVRDLVEFGFLEPAWI